jgi:hypothetical protein
LLQSMGELIALEESRLSDEVATYPFEALRHG